MSLLDLLSDVPTEAQALIDQIASLFQEPTELPPSRACDHDIPLIPGARPVNIRPYRYPPALKDEIEKQVSEMLSKGIIQPSTSLFSSPVLLVKKKDGSPFSYGAELLPRMALLVRIQPKLFQGGAQDPLGPMFACPAKSGFGPQARREHA